MAALGSKWDGLNPRLLAELFPCDRAGAQVAGDTVVAPATDANVEFSAHWQSPFEQMGTESKAPTIAAMAQSGMAESILTAIFGEGGASGAQKLVKDIQGRSGVTKLNSTQIFSGAPPVKISLTLHFRAYNDPAREVQAPIDRLIALSLSQEMAANGAAVNFIEAIKGQRSAIEALFPSKTPHIVGLRFRGSVYAPLVIENLPVPLAVPCDQYGGPLHNAVTIQLGTLTAMDAADWQNVRSGRAIRLS